MFRRILIVCRGNICRSPTAQYLFQSRTKLRGIEVTSAGLNAVVGSAMDAMSLQLLNEKDGVDGSSHRAIQLVPSMLLGADLVIGMEREHIDEMMEVAPEARGKIYLLDKWLDGRDVPDPFRKKRPVFEHAHEMIERGVDSWMRYL
ncbi:low molecular weight phosphotyrosine protein phosphatase [Dyella telluris]|uniref:protein-tyrosine-phosphatase n=1 Tax=Dyella telluris TaxID=2763498 RepID=A0A7G8Q2P7_9GAMM|nr:low molecular weight phosphotyrosine protein phosphatase [Dyella telluris]